MRLLRMITKYFAILFCLYLPLLLNDQSFKGIPTGSENPVVYNEPFEDEVLLLVNKSRRKHKLGILEKQSDLSRAARYHAQDMAIDNYMEHATYDRKNNRLIQICGTFDRIEKFIKMSYLAENISAGKTNPKETVDAWMKSNSHRKNILNPNFKYLGVGYFYYKNSKYLHYWVQDFGG